jgi:3D-(3,5/4)-trihydroxycyclohexane-1,2-dione acylhydrolase (decyclizing)
MRVHQVRVDFAAHAASLGAHVEDVRHSSDVDELREAYRRAREAARTGQRPSVVVCEVNHGTWTEASAWWETGVPAALSGRAAFDRAKAGQLRWL